jgi:hypothetical protein
MSFWKRISWSKWLTVPVSRETGSAGLNPAGVPRVLSIRLPGAPVISIAGRATPLANLNPNRQKQKSGANHGSSYKGTHVRAPFSIKPDKLLAANSDTSQVGGPGRLI